MQFPPWLRIRDAAYVARVLGAEPDRGAWTVASLGATATPPVDPKPAFAKEIDRLAALVMEQASGGAFARRCSGALSKARTELAQAHPDLPKAVETIEEVRQLLVQSNESNRGLWRSGAPLALYNAVWLAFLAYLVFGTLRLYPDSDILVGKNNVAWFSFTAIFWGALGGVFDAFFALWKHFSDRDFDVRFWLWYLIHPILGGGLGILIYLLYMTGYLSITAASPAAAPAAPAVPPGGTTLNPNFIILLAFIAGFKQTTSYNFIIRVVKSIFSEEGGRGGAGGT